MLASLYRSRGRYDEAQPLFAECLRVMRESKSMGDKHPKTLLMMFNYVGLLMGLRQWDKAQKLAEECVRGNVARFGASHKETQEANNLLERVRRKEP